MAFCSKCGAQSEANQRFCVKCGNDLSAAAPSAPAATAPAPAAAPQAYAPSPVPAPVPVQGQFPPPGAVPIMALPQAQFKGKGWLWGLIIVGAVLYGLYYIGSHKQPTAGQPGATPAQQPGAAPGQQPWATPAAAPAVPQPGTAVQPGDPGPGGPNATLVQLQSFAGQYRGYNGSVQIYDARWTNRSNVTIQTAILECDQYAANDAVLAQNRTTLNGPVRSGGTGTYNPFLMGAALQYTKYVNCGVVAVTPAQ